MFKSSLHTASWDTLYIYLPTAFLFNYKNGFVLMNCLISQLYTNVHNMTNHAVFLKKKIRIIYIIKN